MRKILALTAFMAAVAAGARADLLEVSGFGGYTSVGMKDVNNFINNRPAGTTTTDISNGYVAGLDVRTGALIPVPFLEIGLRGEYVGANTGEVKDSIIDIKDSPSMMDGMLGLSFGMDIPATGLGLGLGIYGGYGEGAIQHSRTMTILGSSATTTDYYSGGAFIGEAEARVKYKLISILNIYAFGGWRMANLGTFEDSAKNKFGAANNNHSVDFSGATGGLGINLDF